MSDTSQRGGARPGAGRPKQSGPYQEPTKVIRIPESKLQSVKNWLKTQAQFRKNAEHIWQLKKEPSTHTLPLFSDRISAGALSPAEHHIEQNIDLHQFLAPNPADTYLLRVQGDSMIGAGIFHNDLVVVDRSLKARHNSIIIAAINGELTVKRLRQNQEAWFLDPENDNYPRIRITEAMDFTIGGVVVHVLHAL